MKPGDAIRMMNTKKEFLVTEGASFTWQYSPSGRLTAGDVGYIAASIKNVRDTRVGDTYLADNPAAEPLPGYKGASMVFCGVYPARANTAICAMRSRSCS